MKRGFIKKKKGPPPKKSSVKNPQIWLDVQVAAGRGSSNPAFSGRIVIQLFKDIVPQTAENMRCLATGEKGVGASGKPLSFKGCVFHNIIPDHLIQTGDITANDGTGGESIYGPSFPAENFVGKHLKAGTVSMATTAGKVGSQFYITARNEKMQWLDGVHVVVGRVVSGLDFVQRIANKCGSEDGTPTRTATITDCGRLKKEGGSKQAKAEANDGADSDSGAEEAPIPPVAVVSGKKRKGTSPAAASPAVVDAAAASVSEDAESVGARAPAPKKVKKAQAPVTERAEKKQGKVAKMAKAPAQAAAPQDDLDLSLSASEDEEEATDPAVLARLQAAFAIAKPTKKAPAPDAPTDKKLDKSKQCPHCQGLLKYKGKTDENKIRFRCKQCGKSVIRDFKESGDTAAVAPSARGSAGSAASSSAAAPVAAPVKTPSVFDGESFTKQLIAAIPASALASTAKGAAFDGIDWGIDEEEDDASSYRGSSSASKQSKQSASKPAFKPAARSIRAPYMVNGEEAPKSKAVANMLAQREAERAKALGTQKSTKVRFD